MSPQLRNIALGYARRYLQCGDEAKTLQTGIVVKLTRLCKEHSKLLTSNEKTTCINSLQEMSKTMQKTNPDSFMDGMLREAINALKK